jgi:hypothetical protein
MIFISSGMQGENIGNTDKLKVFGTKQTKGDLT